MSEEESLFEFEMSMSYDDEYDDGFGSDFEDDDFDYEDDEALDEFDDDSDLYGDYDEEDSEGLDEEIDDSYEPFDDVEPESGYSFRTHAAEELYDEDDAIFEEDDGE